MAPLLVVRPTIIVTKKALEVVDSVDSSVDAESVQVGSGLFAFEDVSRGFYNLAALFAISIPTLVFPVPYLITRPCFPKKKSVKNIAVSCRYHTRVEHGRDSSNVGLL